MIAGLQGTSAWLQHSRSHGSITCSATQGLTAENIRVRRANTTIEYRAAAYLRAQAFSVFPEGQGSDFARTAFLRMRGDEKWEEIEEAVKSSSPLILPMVATIQNQEGFPLPSLCIPAVSAAAIPEWVVATLDLNIGPKLPSEELLGKLPTGTAEASTKRAYLSNVCVLEQARQQGLAKRLIASATDLAVQHSIEHLYVHVIFDNLPAQRLYLDHCGFEIESEEKEATARGLGRPRRLLLHRPLA